MASVIIKIMWISWKEKSSAREEASGMRGFGNLGVEQWLSLADLFAPFCEFKFVILEEILGNTHVISPSLILNFLKALLAFPQVFDLGTH